MSERKIITYIYIHIQTFVLLTYHIFTVYKHPFNVENIAH